MTVLAEGHNGVLAVLFDVVGVRGWGSVTNATGKLLDPQYMGALLSGEFVVHAKLTS
jgi:hypothetical protein